MTNGQHLAIEQLKKIESHPNGALEIISVDESNNKSSFITILISISTDRMKILENGLPLKQRELFELLIPQNFPFNPPNAFFTNNDYANYPHVQWGRSICLYISKDLEWIPNDGMFGFIERLANWLIRAGQNQLDQTGEPLHPPSTYIGEESKFNIICQLNLPVKNENIWKGIVLLKRINSNTFQVIDWILKFPNKRNSYSAAIILNQKIPYEYPDKVYGLLYILDKNGINFIDFITFIYSVNKIRKDCPFLFFICSPMMGIKGKKSKYHIACWEIEDYACKAITTFISQSSFSSKSDLIKLESAKVRIFNWAEKYKTKWCHVFDDRQEISVRRDIETKISFLTNKNIYLIGCGALGANVAFMLARSGVRQIVLHDNKEVSPGILIRQPYEFNQIGKLKTSSLKELILRLNQNIKIMENNNDITNLLLEDNQNLFKDIDIIIDCSASNRVHLAFEMYFSKNNNKPHIISMSIDKDMKSGIVLSIGKNYNGSQYCVYRKTFIEFLHDNKIDNIIDNYFNFEKIRSFQPIPGCSEPTFIGSVADSMLYSSYLLNLASLNIDNNDDAISNLVTINEINNLHQKKLNSYILFSKKNSNYKVYICKNALESFKKIIKKNKNPRNETGGLLFGERNDFLNIIWIDKVFGPPPDSKCTTNKFECGINGVKTLNETLKVKYKNQIQFIGSWHTHPMSVPLPSKIDIIGVVEILVQKDFNRDKNLLLIVQPNSSDKFNYGLYLFSKDLINKNIIINYIDC